MVVLLISIDQMPFLAPTFDNAHPLLTLVAPRFNLHGSLEVANPEPASVGSLFNKKIMDFLYFHAYNVH